MGTGMEMAEVIPGFTTRFDIDHCCIGCRNSSLSRLFPPTENQRSDEALVGIGKLLRRIQAQYGRQQNSDHGAR